MVESQSKHPETEPTTIVSQLTGSGRAAVAVLAVAGPHAVEAVDEHFVAANSLPLSEQGAGKIIFGHWGISSGEEVVLCRRDLQTVEIHCHGGSQAAGRISNQLMEEGCQRVEWQNWIARWSCNRLESEAQEAIAHALTRRTAMILLDQIHGALRHEVLDICRALRPGTVPSQLQTVDHGNALHRIEILLRRAEVGYHLTKPWHLMVAGRPNTGKSSLVNALVGYDRSIVFDVPGTTRDVVSVRGTFDGWPVWIEDTAGMCHTPDPIERQGIELARQRIPTIDLLIWVLTAPEIFCLSGLDAGKSASQIAQREIVEYLGKLPDGLPVQVVVNKIDLYQQEPMADESARGSAGRSDDQADIAYTSAPGGYGIGPLIATLARRMAPGKLAPGDAVPINGRQQSALLGAQRALCHGDCLSALAALEGLLGGDASPPKLA